jgi:hypothetical protein
MANYTLTESYHNQKNKKIWLVKPSAKLDYSDYKKLESKIKILGGYYSRFTKSFVFENEPSTEQLDEAFGNVADSGTQAREAGVPQSQVAKIAFGKNATVDRRTLRSEYNDGKLLVAKTSYFDGMYDTTRSIPANEQVWSSKDPGFERQFDYSRSPYISGNYISFGDYDAKYKPGILPKVVAAPVKQSSLNFYVDIDYSDKVNKDDSYKLDRVDSKRNDLEEGQRVVMSLYGNKYCGKIIDKQISKYRTSTTVLFSGTTTYTDHEDVRYKVLLDNGITQTYATFKLDTENECDEITVPAIVDVDGTKKLPEAFWSFEIVRQVNSINSMKKQKAARKKAEYAAADQKSIDRLTKIFLMNANSWLGWEKENKEYSQKITGETEDEQEYRISKWTNDLGVVPKAPPKVKKTLTEKLIELNTLI